jgi:lysophospholipase L1-like esterase
MAKKKLLPANLLVVLVTLAIAVFLCEWVLRLLGYPATMSPQTAHPAGFHEIRKRIEFTQDFRTNSQGLRYREISFEKEPNHHRVFVVGDSFTEGWGVDEGQRFTDLLEKKFDAPDDGVLFINGGLAGGGLVQYGRLFLDKGVKYHPDGLLICIYANDVSTAPDLTGEIDASRSTAPGRIERWVHRLWPRIHTRFKMLEARREYRQRTSTTDFIRDITAEAIRRGIPQKRIDTWRESLPTDLVEAINQGRFNGSILSYGLLYPNYWVDSIDIFSTTATEKWRSVMYVLSEMIDQSRKINVEVAVVFIPCVFLYDPTSHEQSDPWVRSGTIVKARWLEETTQVQRRFEAWSKSAKVPFLDLTPTFREAIRYESNLNWKLDGHWTAAGHQVAAEAIEAWLSSGKVFSFIASKQ